MPTFRDIDDLVHTWAQNNTGRGSCGNVSYSGPVLCSYNDTIALFVGGPNGIGCLLGLGGSLTTTRHTNAAEAATRRPTFRVYCDLTERTTPDDARAAWAAKIVRACVDYAEAPPRKASKAKHLRILREYIAAANDLCLFYDLPKFDAAPEDKDADAYTATRAAGDIARRAEERRVREERDRVNALDAGERLALWLTGADVSRRDFGLLRATVGDCLRVSTDGDVETTQGARVPLAHVRDRAPLLLRMVRSRRGWQRNGHTIHLGHYSVDRVDVDGTLHAGCHTFHRAELERFAAVLNVTEAAPD